MRSASARSASWVRRNSASACTRAWVIAATAASASPRPALLDGEVLLLLDQRLIELEIARFEPMLFVIERALDRRPAARRTGSSASSLAIVAVDGGELGLLLGLLAIERRELGALLADLLISNCRCIAIWLAPAPFGRYEMCVSGSRLWPSAAVSRAASSSAAREIALQAARARPD